MLLKNLYTGTIHFQAVRVAGEMVIYLEGDEQQRQCYLKSLYMCLSPTSLVPLAVVMYQRYAEVCPDKLEVLFNYPDTAKVIEHSVPVMRT